MIAPAVRPSGSWRWDFLRSGTYKMKAAVSAGHLTARNYFRRNAGNLLDQSSSVMSQSERIEPQGVSSSL